MGKKEKIDLELTYKIILLCRSLKNKIKTNNIKDSIVNEWDRKTKCIFCKYRKYCKSIK